MSYIDVVENISKKENSMDGGVIRTEWRTFVESVCKYLLGTFADW